MYNSMRLIMLQSMIISMLLFPTELMADDFYVEHMTSPQVSDMFRYGNVETSLFTGKLNFAIPIYSLEDPDFDLDIALRYNSEGFKPRKHSGYVGYNWFLEVGGCITREVKNFADETQRNYGEIPTQGMLSYLRSQNYNVNSNLIFNLDNSVVTDCGSKGHNLDPQCEYDIDFLPDLFHFNFCGYQGIFLINNRGKAVVINGDYIDIDLSKLQDRIGHVNNQTLPWPNTSSQISVKTRDGYTYVFGGDLSAIEYSVATKNNETLIAQDPPIINTWNLKQIIAPNQRSVTFYYKPSVAEVPNDRDNLWVFNEYYNYFRKKEHPQAFPQPIEYETSMGYSMTKESILDSILVSGKHNVHILFHNSSAQHTLYERCAHYPLSRNNYMLDSICIKTDEYILRKACLTSLYKSHITSANSNTGIGFYWRFLSSVKISGIGTYSMRYNCSNTYPDIFTPDEAHHESIDFYGYWKSNKLNNILTEITYPTGGQQIITYEPHDCGTEHRYVTFDSADVKLVSLARANQNVAGVRIKRIDTKNTDGELIETRIYNYKQKGNANSSGVYYNNLLIYSASNSTTGFLMDNRCCYSLLSSHIGYSYIEEAILNITTGDIYKISYTFNIGQESYNSSSDLNINRMDKKMYTDNIPDVFFILSGILSYDSELDLSGKLLLQEFYTNDTLVQSKQFDYNCIPQDPTEFLPKVPSALGCTDTIIVFSHRYATFTRKLFVCPNLIRQKIINDFYPNGQRQPLVNATSYIYDKKFRIKKETTTNSDGMTYFTKYTYPDEFNISYISSFGPYPSPYALLKKRNQISEPIETISGYMDGDQEKVTSGRINLFKVNRAIALNDSRSVLPGEAVVVDSNLIIIPDSMILQMQLYPVLYKNLDLHIANSINDYQSISVVNDSLRYDSRYRLTCTYEFDPMLRLTSITPVNNVTTSYTWDGIYPVSKTVGNQTSTFSYIPYVGMSSMTDARGVTTYYAYDTYGRLIEVYRQHNTHGKEILNHYIYHTKTE